MSRYPPRCKSLIGGHLLLLDSSSSLRRRSGDIHRRWHRVSPRAYMSVFLVERLSQMLGTPYHRPASRTSASSTATRTKMCWMSVMTVSMARVRCRTHYLALPISRNKTHTFVMQFACLIYLLQYVTLRQNRKANGRLSNGFATSSFGSFPKIEKNREKEERERGEGYELSP